MHVVCSFVFINERMGLACELPGQLCAPPPAASAITPSAPKFPCLLEFEFHPNFEDKVLDGTAPISRITV